MSEIKPVIVGVDLAAKGSERTVSFYPAAAYEAQTHRANALATVVNDLTKMVTHDGETKDQFIERVKAILSFDPDLRVSEMQVAYEALQKENAELKEELDRERMRLAACGVAALGNTKSCVEKRISKDSPYYSDSYSCVCRAVDEEIRLRDENEAQAKRIAELELSNTLHELSRGTTKEEMINEIESLRKQTEIAIEYLQRLSCLGNDGLTGNSLGNVIAIEALNKISASKNGE